MFFSVKIQRTIGLLGIYALIAMSALASGSVQANDTDNTSLSSLIQLGLQNSIDQSASRLESKSQDKNETLISRTQNIPQINLTASYQKYHYDSLYDKGGQLVSNDGQRPAFGVTVSYDLQKLLNADSALARQSAQLAKIQEKISGRDVIRNIKKGYYGIVEIQAEVEELTKLIGLFSRIDDILQKQKRMGIYNEIERKQFQVQKSILDSDLQTRSSDLEAAYFQLSLVMNVSVDTLKDRVPKIKTTSNLHFAQSKFSPEKLSALNDQEILANLSGSYNLAKMEYDNFHSMALPTVYVRQSREMPTMPSSDGYQNITEVGLSFPIDSFFTRSAQKSQLGAKAEKAEVLFQKTLLDYRNQIRLNTMNMNRYQGQTHQLEETRKEAKGLLDKSFLFYSQKRIDVLGTLDIFQKYLQATRNVLINSLQIQNIDAELEYLVGGGV